MSECEHKNIRLEYYGGGAYEDDPGDKEEYFCIKCHVCGKEWNFYNEEAVEFNRDFEIRPRKKEKLVDDR